MIQSAKIFNLTIVSFFMPVVDLILADHLNFSLQIIRYYSVIEIKILLWLLDI